LDASTVENLENITLDVPSPLDPSRHLGVGEGISIYSSKIGSISGVIGFLREQSSGLRVYNTKIGNVSGIVFDTTCTSFSCLRSYPINLLSAQVEIMRDVDLTAQVVPLSVDATSSIGLLSDSTLQASTPSFIAGQSRIREIRNLRTVQR